jgi:N6-adenosine-specific RNA methylase IME4
MTAQTKTCSRCGQTKPLDDFKSDSRKPDGKAYSCKACNSPVGFVATERLEITGMIPFHPLADIFPLIEGPEFDDLVRDIRAHGLREPITLLDKKILDGRNRYRACVAAGLLPESIDALTAPQIKYFRLYSPPGTEPPSHDELLAFVLSKNLHRRQLNESQRSMVAANLATMRQGERTDIEPSANLQKVAQNQAAERLNVSPRTVADAVKVKRDAAPELREAVEQGHLAVSVAAKAATLPAEDQRQIAEKAKSGHGSAARAHVKEKSRSDNEQALSVKQKALPDKRYGVILADPEWRFEPYSRETGMDRAADNHYPTNETDVICARPVQDIAADDCALFLWATVPMLSDALRVMAAWGFDYKSHLVWKKDRLGTGYWFRNQHELLLVGTRGARLPAPAPGTQFPSFIEAPVGDHSEKPDLVYEVIESYFPNLPKIELNARRARAGWECWGFEAPDSEIPREEASGTDRESPSTLCERETGEPVVGAAGSDVGTQSAPPHHSNEDEAA